jgi:hypothetical protein
MELLANPVFAIGLYLCIGLLELLLVPNFFGETGLKESRSYMRKAGVEEDNWLPLAFMTVLLVVFWPIALGDKIRVYWGNRRYLAVRIMVSSHIQGLNHEMIKQFTTAEPQAGAEVMGRALSSIRTIMMGAGDYSAGRHEWLGGQLRSIGEETDPAMQASVQAVKDALPEDRVARIREMNTLLEEGLMDRVFALLIERQDDFDLRDVVKSFKSIQQWRDQSDEAVWLMFNAVDEQVAQEILDEESRRRKIFLGEMD